MIDQSSQFMAILTAVGKAKQANANAMNIPWTFSQMGVGDANGADPQPNQAQTKLINERRRAPLNQVKIDPKNTNVIIAEQVIPENVGGWWIREIGLYDADGDLVAVANCAPSFKPELAQGSGKTQVVRINFIVSSAANVTLKIDPSVVLATRQYVDDRIIEVLPPTRKPGSYTKVLIDKRGVVLEGSNPETLAGNGIIDAYTKEQIDGALKLKAPLASPALTGIPTAPTAASGSNSQQLANTAFVQATVSAVISGAPGALDTLKELADALGGDPNFATTIINALAGKAGKATTLAGYDITDGLAKGQYGLGGTVAPRVEIDAIGLPGGFYYYGDGYTSFENYVGLVNIPYGSDGHAGQLGFIQGGTGETTVLVRSVDEHGVWKPTRSLWHSGNLDPSALAQKSTTLGGYGITDAYTQSQTNNLLADRAPLISPALTGMPTVPTAALGSNNLQVANTSFVQATIAAVISGAPGALDTLRELADALGGDPNFANTVINALAGKAAKATTLAGYGITNALAKGDYGLGGTTPSGLGVDFIGLPGGFYIKGEGPTSFANYTSLINIPYGDGFAAQIGFGQSSVEPQIYVRGCKAPNVWGMTRKLWHTGNLEAAEQADVEAGLNDTQFVTPKKMRSGFYFLPAANGVIALPSWLGGFIFQWGRVTLNDGSSAVVNFPLAFPNTVLAHWSSINSDIAGYGTTCPTSGTSGSTLSGMRVSYNDNNGAGGVSVGWFSIGR